MVVMMSFMSSMMEYATKQAAMGGEVLSGIRTLVSLQNEQRVMAEQEEMVKKKEKSAGPSSVLLASVFAIFFAMNFAICAFVAIMGGTLVINDRRAVTLDAGSWDAGSAALECSFPLGTQVDDWSMAGTEGIAYSWDAPGEASTGEVEALPPLVCNASIACALGGGNCGSSTACEASCISAINACVDGTTCMTGTEIGSVLIIFFFGMMASFGAVMGLERVAKGAQGAAKVLKVTERDPKIVAYERGANNDIVVAAKGVVFSANNLGDELDSTTTPIIKFENVRFRYPSRPLRPVLRGLNFEIKRGTTTAFVGTSGSGKSTVMQLLLRFYDADSGRILLNGAPLQTYDISSLRDEVGVVGQEPKLFQARIWENIAWGARTSKLDAMGDLSRVPNFEALLTMEQAHRDLHAAIIAASKAAEAYDFIQTDLDLKFDQVLLEGGRSISGGQKQRIAIARALVREPKVLLLDEATSALDSESERKVQAALDSRAASKGGDVTMLVIAHRLSTIVEADNVIVLDDGDVVESGTYAELAARAGGRFRAMLDEQGIDSAQSSRAASPVHGDAADAGAAAASASADGAAVAAGLETDAPIAAAAKADASGAKSSSTAIAVVADDAVDATSDAKYSALGLLRSGFRLVLCSGAKTRCIFILSTVVGIFGQPLIMLAQLLEIFVISIVYSDRITVNLETSRWTMFGVFLGTGVLIFFVGLLWYTPMMMVYGKIANTFRMRAYRALLAQKVAFYDKTENSVGVLTALIAGKADQASRLTGPVQMAFLIPFSITVISISTMIFGDWRLCLAMAPLICITIVFRAGKRVIEVRAWNEMSDQESVGDKIFYEALSAIRTVKQFNMGDRITAHYGKLQAVTLRKAQKDALFMGLMMTVSEAVVWFAFAVITLLCAVMVRYAGASPVRMVMTVGSFMSLLQLSDEATRGLADGEQSISALRELQKIEETAQDMNEIDGTLPQAKVDAAVHPEIESVSDAEHPLAIELKEVSFAYPTRKAITVLNEISIAIESGTSAAFVGPSGCGKSTIYGLLLRWYDINGGDISVDGLSIKKHAISGLRSRISLVGQEVRLSLSLSLSLSYIYIYICVCVVCACVRSIGDSARCTCGSGC